MSERGRGGNRRGGRGSFSRGGKGNTSRKSSTDAVGIVQMPRGALVGFTIHGVKYTGTFHSLDSGLNHLALFSNVRPESDEKIQDGEIVFSLIPTDVIRDSSVLKEAENAVLSTPQVPYVSEENRTQLEELLVEKRMQHASMIGPSVTEDAQRIFEFLSRTMKCQWKRFAIFVSDVYIDPPYTVASCRGENAKPQAIQHVTKSLSHARKSLGLSG